MGGRKREAVTTMDEPPARHQKYNKNVMIVQTLGSSSKG
jgi:hypothetical protein